MFHLLNEYAKLLKFKPKVPHDAVELCPESLACSAQGVWRQFMEDSLEMEPRESDLCTLPPPYEPQEINLFKEEKVKRTKEVEAWENEYWDEQNKKNQQ